jgi:oxygen-dependent protoporphyrinogen oxidase
VEGVNAHVVVVGAGIAGLSAARFLLKAGLRVTVLEGSPAIGGKLKISEVAGIPVDEGAESMLARRPEGLDLVRELGLSDQLVYPGTTSAAILSHGSLRAFPAGQVMGVPSDLKALARSGVLSQAGLARAALDIAKRPTPRGADISVADYVGDRLGQEVVDRLVEPLLAGVYAGRAENLSFEATLPQLAGVSRTHRSLIMAAKSVIDNAPANAGPVFTTLAGGLGNLPLLLADAVREQGGVIRTEAMARELTRTTTGWRIIIGPRPTPEVIDADAVILAVPALPAGRLLAHVIPAAAKELDAIDYASMAIVTLAYHSTAFPRLPKGSGYLVPAIEGHSVKAVTFSSVKWPWLRDRDPHLIIVRASIGRFGEEQVLQRPDSELKAIAMTELAGTCHASELPVDTRVTRWGGGLPQYTVGHNDRVSRIRAAVAGHPGLAVCGAAYDGLGIPACISTARAAAARIIDQMTQLKEES